MAHRTARQAGEDIQFARWFYWQMLRRSPKYRLAVAEFLKSVRERRRWLIGTIDSQSRRNSRLSTEERLEAWGRASNQRDLLRACERVLETYREIRWMRSSGNSGNRVTDAVGKCIAESTTSDRSAHGPRGLIQPLPGDPRAILRELDLLTRRWSMRFPLPPSVEQTEQTLEYTFTTSGRVHPVRIKNRGNGLTLEIRLGLPKKMLLAFVDGALHHFVLHKKEWKTVSRKPPRSSPLVTESVKIARSDRMPRVQIPIENSLLSFDKGVLLHLIGAQIPGSSALRLRKDEAVEMFKVADLLRLNRSGRGPKKTRSKVAKRIFSKNPQVYFVRKREARFLQLRAMLSL